MAASPVAHPDRWETDVVLADGGTVHVRPLTPGDRGLIEAFHARQSRESIYFRYFSPMPTLSAREIDRLTNVDQLVHMGFVALLGDEIVGIASYDVIPGRNEAEAAFIVDDEHQGRGIATVLLEYLVVAAREHGLDALTAQVLPNNRRMVSVFHQVGFEVASEFADGVIEVRLALEPTPQSTARIEERERRSEARSVERLLFPSSVAVIGASQQPDGLGNRVVRNLLAHGFDGPVYAVSNHGLDVAGAPGYASLGDVPGDVDVAIIAVPADAVADVVEECGRKRVHGLVVITAGLDRPVDDGLSLEHVVVERARRFGMRVIGPESLGVINTDATSPLYATFARVGGEPGDVGFLTQSGTLGIAALEHARRSGVGISTFVDIGSRPDVSGNDLLQFWWDDPQTSVVLLYLETFGNPRKFTRIARQMARSKPIVAVKSGRTLATDGDEGLDTVWPTDATVDALLAQSGVIRVDTPPELFAVARVLLHQPVPAGDRVAVVSNSTGATTLAVDACVRSGLDVRDTRAMTWQAGPDDYRREVRDALAAPDVDAILLVYAPPVRERRAEIVAAVAESIEAHSRADGVPKPVVATFLGGGDEPTIEAGSVTLPLFEFPGDAARVLGLVARHGLWLSQPEGHRVAAEPVRVERTRAVVDAVLGEAPEGRWLDRDEAAELLGAAGFEVAAHRYADSVDEAVDAACELGYPVVLKATGVERYHRGEGGGVALDLHDDQELRAAYGRMDARLGAEMHPAVVQRMVDPGADVLVGAHQHPSFGGVLSIGIGGVMAAANPDLPTRVLPVTDEDAARLVAASPVAALLAAESADGGATEACHQFLSRLSGVLEAVPEIADLYLNPLIVQAGGVHIVDAWVRVAPYRWDPSPAVRRLG
jgi:acyl-CoA synthetase (NDP forming)/ribosomal protein S18 acetylase RimI-like enzyme